MKSQFFIHFHTGLKNPGKLPDILNTILDLNTHIDSILSYEFSLTIICTNNYPHTPHPNLQHIVKENEGVIFYDGKIV